MVPLEPQEIEKKTGYKVSENLSAKWYLFWEILMVVKCSQMFFVFSKGLTVIRCRNGVSH